MGVSIFNNKRLFDPDTVRYITQLASGRPDYIYQRVVDDLVTGIKIDDNWEEIDRLWLFANAVQPLARVSLVNPLSTQITEVNAPAWVAKQGYTSDGATSYLNSNFIPSTDGVRYTLNDASMGIYSRTNTNAVSVDMGSFELAALRFNTVHSREGGVLYVYINDNLGATAGATVADSLGLSSGRRTSATACETFKNGASIGTHIAIAAIPPISQYILCRNNVGTADTFSGRQISFAYFGSSAVNQSKLYARIQRYMSALGTQV